MRSDDPRRDGAAEGRRRKDAALSHLELRRAAFIRRARREFLHVLLARGSATSDDLRQRLELPEGIDPKVFGAVPGALAKAGIIAQDGFATTARPEAHARPVGIWKLVNRQLAEKWLAENRDCGSQASRHDGDQGLLFDQIPKRQEPRW
ncbi:MAG TPA: hypothetical protein VMP01_11155 [Pirellulaceae bacterium]|nr:hypothetical protein [Pirellulaceae bacterium]